MYLHPLIPLSTVLFTYCCSRDLYLYSNRIRRNEGLDSLTNLEVRTRVLPVCIAHVYCPHVLPVRVASARSTRSPK